MKCANPTCGRSVRRKTPWQLYCSPKCGDRMRHRRSYAKRARRRPSRRYYRMFMSLIDAAEQVRKMTPVG